MTALFAAHDLSVPWFPAAVAATPYFPPLRFTFLPSNGAAGEFKRNFDRLAQPSLLLNDEWMSGLIQLLPSRVGSSFNIPRGIFFTRTIRLQRKPVPLPNSGVLSPNQPLGPVRRCLRPMTLPLLRIACGKPCRTLLILWRGFSIWSTSSLRGNNVQLSPCYL